MILAIEQKQLVFVYLKLIVFVTIKGKYREIVRVKMRKPHRMRLNLIHQEKILFSYSSPVCPSLPIDITAATNPKRNTAGTIIFKTL